MAASPQQFCLRWNNHQSNIVSVFEQLLHSEAFVDVTLAVEGMSLKAHKVVLSACSPYFQAVLASHPDKHPIVILKDVRYGDMRDLLDFMYRGEVSVDQDNLSSFLKVAESLRIKGLTEVNEKKRRESSSSPYLLHQGIAMTSSCPTIPIGSPSAETLKRPLLSPTFGHNKRRRGRPPKISGDESDGETANNSTGDADCSDVRTDAEEKAIKVEAEDPKDDVPEEARDGECRTNGSSRSSGDSPIKDEQRNLKTDSEITTESPGSARRPISRMSPNSPAKGKRPRGRPPRVPRVPQDSSKWLPLLPKPSNKSEESVATKTEIHQATSASPLPHIFLTPAVSVLPQPVPSFPPFELQHSTFGVTSTSSASQKPYEVRDFSSLSLPGGVLPLSVELGVGSDEIVGIGDNAPSEPPIDITEGVQMGIKVRGLDLMRYGRYENGLYRCSECEKIQIPKTFKTSYSFQRHAYLYHEGSPKRFPCPACGKEFSRPDKRKSHLKEKHGLFNADNIDTINESLE